MKAWHYARILQGCVNECLTRSCVHVLLIVAAVKACIIIIIKHVLIKVTLSCERHCRGICVWRPSANIPIGSVSLQVSPCWGVRGQEKSTEWTTLGLDCVPGLRSAVQMYCTAWHVPGLHCSAPSALPATFSQSQRFTVGLTLQLQPIVMLAESNTQWNRLNP